MIRRGIQALVVFLALPCGLAAAMQEVEGIALRLPDRTVAYREYHAIGTHSQHIEYRAPDGQLIAEQRLDYACSDSAPAFEQRDLRDASSFGARWEDGSYVLYSGARKRALADADPLVASSGFDRFVQTHWEALESGAGMEFDFALPARLQALRLRIQRSAAPPSDTHSGPWFRVEPASAWLRPFVDPIVLGYDAQRRLLVYRGVSNLVDADGSSLDVDIRYRYTSTTARPIPAKDRSELFAEAARTSGNSNCGDERT